jgi:acyl-CoA thioesterase I
MHLLKKSAALLLALAIVSCSDKKQNNNNTIADTLANKSDLAGQTTPTSKKSILVFGDSLTAGYGLDDPSEAFPGVIKAKIDSLKLPYTVINAGVSGETSAGGLGRIDWILKQKPDIFLLELGANDGLRGNSVAQTISNLQAIIDKVKAKYPTTKIILLGMQVPPSMGQQYVSDFKKMYPDLAAKNHIRLVPFLLENVGGIAKLNQADGIHPTAAGAKIVAENVWKILKPELQ